MSDLVPKGAEGGENEGLSEAQEAKLGKRLSHTCKSLIVLLCLGSLFAAFQDEWRATAMALLWALACLAIGYVAGFLFAVPRAPKSLIRPRPDDASEAIHTAASTASHGFNGLGINTNLEEISDWLTKIMVGLGLVQFRSIPRYVREIGEYVADGLGKESGSAASGLVLYFFSLGFISGYLLTRMFFSPAFLLADRATRGGIKDEKAREIASSAKAEIKVDSDVETAITALRQAPRQLGRIDQLINLLEEHRKRFPLKRKLNIVLARLYAEGKGELDKSIEVLNQFVKIKRKARELDEDLADALWNVACNYSSKLDGADADRRKDIGAKALKALKQSLELVPSYAKDVVTDPDLEPLRNAPEFADAVRNLLNSTNTNDRS